LRFQSSINNRQYHLAVVLRRRRLLIALGILLLLPLAGALIERRAETRDAARFPPAGMLVDIGGRRLHLLCIGQGPRDVVFEVSGFSNSTLTQRNSRAAPALRTDVPLVVMSAERSRGLLPPAFSSMVNPDEIVPPLRAAHQHLARMSSRGVRRIVEGSGHLIANDRPQVVADAVFDLLHAH
jgi:pimeloyl-ACP methyl ester carboxylesterase